MLNLFHQYITDKKLFRPSDKIILAVSGGMDSVVMCHLFHLAKFEFAIAHCNFQLRGVEANEDEIFVKNLAVKYQVPIYVQHFQTAAFAEEKKISIQMAARELRYQWFEEILNKESYQYIATAHHKNDVLETILLNLTKGTGIHGLHGIKPKVGNLVRPLLFASREEIQKYIQEEKLSWREDSSNESLKYQRNLIRLEVIPVLKKINPGLEDTIEQTIEKITAVENIFDNLVEEVKQKAFVENANHISININLIKSLPEPGIILFEMLKIYDFNYTDILNLLHAEETGKKIESETHIAVKDRKDYIITKKEKINSTVQLIGKDQKEISNSDFKLSFHNEENKDYKIPNSAEIASLDFNKLHFPLTLRKWQEGDCFYPLGMKNKKKVSDFLIDLKIPLNLKEKVMVMLSGENIVWIIGLRIDERFKVLPDTEKIFVMKKENL